MTTIHPETQIVGSRYEALSRICEYTYQHSDGSRYTVKVPIDALERSGNAATTRQQRRLAIAQKIISHVQNNPPDHIELSDAGRSAG